MGPCNRTRQPVAGAYHSSGIFVFNSQGRLRLFMGPNIWLNAMVHDLELLLRDAPKATRP